MSARDLAPGFTEVSTAHARSTMGGVGSPRITKKENMADERKAVEVVVKGENKKMDTEEDGCK